MRGTKCGVYINTFNLLEDEDNNLPKREPRCFLLETQEHARNRQGSHLALFQCQSRMQTSATETKSICT